MVTLNLEIDDEMMTVNIPDSWSEVDVETFSKLWGFDRTNMTQLELDVAVVSILTGIDEDSLWLLRPDAWNKVVEIIEFATHVVKGEKVDSIIVDGEEYFLYKDYEKFNLGEIASIKLLASKAQNGNLASVFPELLCIFLRKKKENGKMEQFKKSFMERAESFKKVSIAYVNDLLLFFSDGMSSNEKNTLHSSQK